MKNLFNFILRYVHWLLFFLLTFFSLYLLINNSEFQRSKYLSAFQEIAGRVHSISSNVHSYLNLKKTNADLMQRLGVLEEENQAYKEQLGNLTDRIRTDSVDIGFQPSYQYIHASVVEKQIFEANNYLILNKGSNDSIKEDMAVVSAKGIVGVVLKVTPRFSRIIPVINPEFRPTCMIKSTHFFGTLYWDGKDPRYATLSRLPGHASYTIGDTIVTSGYSAIFPQGAYVGVVEDAYKQKNEEYNSLKIRLFTDFSTLTEVFIIRYLLQDERNEIQKGGSQE